MEFDEEQEGHEEEMEIPAAPPGYDSLGNSGKSRIGGTVGAEAGASAITPTRKGGPSGSVRYRECQKNHAVSIGGHAVDGCGDFMAAGEEGTLDGLKCAACNCHRNFHRKEIDGETSPYQQQPVPQPHHQYNHQFSQYYRAQPPPAVGYFHHHLTTPPQYRPLALPAVTSGGGTSRDEEDVSNPSSSGGGGVAGSGGGGGSGTRKRFRTKFTPEQKEKMLAFAEQLGWRIQKHDEAAVEQFCEETGVKRQVLKVWMHNNKHTIGKKP